MKENIQTAIPSQSKKELQQWVESELQKKSLFNINIDKNKIQEYFAVAKKYLLVVYDFFKDNKNNSKVMMIIAAMTFGVALYFARDLYANISYVRGKTQDLVYLKSYDIRPIQTNEFTQPIVKYTETLEDIWEEDEEVKKEIAKYQQYLAALQIPYTYFLQYVYLPSLNVRKEKYTNKIDTTLMGIQFLEKNPYNDITLLQKRWDFFKNLGDNNETNDILDMKIGDLVEDEKWFFSMPITVSFVANSKRAFLLLADKLSITSNKENISLINEFFYYLRNEIKKWKEVEIKNLEKKYSGVWWSGEESDQDKIVGYHIYKRIFAGESNVLIDNKIIDKTIKNIVSCTNETDEVCYYKFRERYRDIPSFGYLLWTDFGSNGAENLKKFIVQMPPIFSIKEFVFDKIKQPTLSNTNNIAYQGKVTIVVYGRSASLEEVEEIALALWKKCLWENKKLTTQEWLNLVQSAIVRLSDLSRVEKIYGDNLRELKNIFENIHNEYDSLNNYKKTIRNFEIYRMLFDAGLCK